MNKKEFQEIKERAEEGKRLLGHGSFHLKILRKEVLGPVTLNLIENDVPKLLAEVEELRAEQEQMRGEIESPKELRAPRGAEEPAVEGPSPEPKVRAEIEPPEQGACPSSPEIYKQIQQIVKSIAAAERSLDKPARIGASLKSVRSTRTRTTNRIKKLKEKLVEASSRNGSFGHASKPDATIT